MLRSVDEQHILPHRNPKGTDMTTLTTPAYNAAKEQAFADRFVAALNETAVLMMISIGHRTSLFDTLDGAEPMTSRQLADAAELHERYVREWLGAMVTGRIIDYDAANETYRLPAEHARWLTRRVSPENLAVTAQWISVLGHVESQVVETFKQGGGVPYACFHRFHEVMAAESAQTVVAALEEHILPLANGIADQLQQGINVLEIGCGSGQATCRLAQLYPQSTFTAYDLCQDAIESATNLAQKLELTNVRFDARDITMLDDEQRFDLVLAFDVIHDQKDPATVLANVHRALKPGGTFLVQDIAASSYLQNNLDHPIGAFLYTISTMHCMTVSLAQGGKGLGTVWGEELALRMLDEAGFAAVQVHKLPHDFMNSYYVTSRP
jgi:2-polyprenyl-3-methyl-5-hydroxy-6-metoxy-1,4-benzoquinol methylase